MKISRLRAQNFKSFDTVDVGLGDFNVFIGANASGKSNFLSILTFLRDIARDGLEDAVSMQSGEIDLLRNVQLGSTQPTKVCVELGHGLDDPGEPPELGWGGFWEASLRDEKARLSGSCYEIEFQYDRSEFWISNEEATWTGYFWDKEEDLKDGTFEVRSTDRDLLRQQKQPTSRNGVPSESSKARTSLLQSESGEMWSTLARHQMLAWRTYDFKHFRAISGGDID
jgi:predicted ATPase